MWYSKGTVVVTNGSDVVASASGDSDFVRYVTKGEAFIAADGLIYEIKSIEDRFTMKLTKVYGGATNAAAVYTIAPIQGWSRELAARAAELIDRNTALLAEASNGIDDIRVGIAQAQDKLDQVTVLAADAQASKTAADTSANLAAGSATESANSAAAAAASTVTAGSHAAAALDSKNAAAASATASANSAGQANTHKNDAAVSLAAAQVARTGAESAKTAATNEKVAAESAKAAAAASAVASSNSATAASNSASAALASKNAASASETAAANSASGASTSASNAAASASAAGASKTDAQAARDAAQNSADAAAATAASVDPAAIAADIDSVRVLANSKQDALVSGTNVKTIGGTSVLGSGNISFPAVVVNLSATAAADKVTVTNSAGTGATLPAATSSNAGLILPAEKTKLAGIAAGAQVNVATNLSTTFDATSVLVHSSTGESVLLPQASTAVAGVMQASSYNALSQLWSERGLNAKTNVNSVFTGLPCFERGLQVGTQTIGAQSNIASYPILTFGTKVGFYDTPTHGGHSAFAIHGTMVDAWGTGGLAFACATEHGAFNFTSPALYLRDTNATFKGSLSVGHILTVRNNIEIFAPTPHIDFHFNNSAADYTSRIIEYSSGALTCIGSWAATGNVSAYSDRKLKKDIRAIPDPLCKISKLFGKTFTRIDTGERQTGLIAQDVQAVLPEAVSAHVDAAGEEVLSVAYGNLVGLLVEGIKALEARVAELEAAR